LIVTFTEKGTEELRAGIRGLLEDILAAASTASSPDASRGDLVTIDGVGQSKLESALFGFERAPIYTIHAFCRRILSDLAFAAGAPFGLEVVDAHRVFHRTFRSTLREEIATEPATQTLLDEWLAEGDTAGRPNLIDSLEDLLRDAHLNRYLQSDASEAHRRACARLADAFDPELLKRLCARKTRAASDEALRAAEQLAILIRQNRRSADSLRGALAGFDFDALRYRSTNAKRDAREQSLIDTLEGARTACSLELRVVDGFLPLVERRLLEDKRDHGEIDYGDMLEWVWNALCGARGASLAALLRERFPYGLVDEFQDTDDLQWKIFREVFLARGGRNILHVVGDPKQAIYGFRGADVYTYLTAREEILRAGGELIKLVENHRSTGDYVEAINQILDQDAHAPLFTGDIKYDAPVQCARRELRAHRASGAPVVPVTLLRYCPGPAPGSAAQMRAALGRHIAREIRGFLFDPHCALDITDADGTRRLGANDIYILTRTGAEAVEIGEYLREQGVPFAFYKKEGLFQTPEAYDVLDVLRAILEPDSESKRLKALISPFLAVPYRDLFESDEPEADGRFMEQLHEWNAFAEEMRFDILFDQLLHRTGLVSRELFFSNSERELTNYLHILELLLEQALTESLSLREIVSRLDAFIAGTALPDERVGDIQRIESDRSAVRILSVHMSKGLQAHIVFLFGGAARPPMPPRITVYHDEQRKRRIAIGKDARAAASDVINREAREEDQRLAYVGMTRGIAKLYLPIYPEGSLKK
ncbi:MAG TPA: UvrD-helicase domain-containing protein, partial [Candidatus Binataceae bacterium]|nr:UvrD-helicase domain-containing protein [Candidatus Binataceae bacterium]